MAVLGCLATFVVLVIAGITYGIILYLKPYFHKADFVHPGHNDTRNEIINDTYLKLPFHELHNYTTVITDVKNVSVSISQRSDQEPSTAISAFPTSKPELPPQCADPTFACQDLDNARLCGVVKSCVHDIWSTMSAPDDNDEICDICKEMVKEARDQLLSNMTQEEIKEVFEGSCKLLPIKLVADACIKVVDEIIPELVEMLASRMDPNMVCTVSGLCNMAHLPVENHILKVLRMILTSNKGNQCTQCTAMMTDVKKFLNSSSEADVKTDLEKFCDKEAPSYLCDIMLDTYFPKIYQYIVSTDAKTLCSSVDICPKKCSLNDEEPKLKDDLTCEFCEHVLQHIKDLITTNTTLDEFKTALLNFCKHMGSFSDKCTSLVNDYYDMLFDYIKTLDTKGMCTLIGLCQNTRCAEIPLIKLIPAVETRPRIPLFKLRPADPVVKQNEDIHPLVSLIPENMLSKKQMVESNDISMPQLPLERYIHPLPLFQKDTDCALCKAISFYIAQDLNGDRSKNGVKKAVDGVCDKWVKDFPVPCNQLINKYGMKIRQFVAKGTELEDICTSMKVCAAENRISELDVKIIPKGKDNPLCDLCKDAMNEVEKQLNDPATKQKVENLLKGLCNIVPQSWKDDCTSFIDENVDAIFDTLKQEMKPDNICPALGLCTASLRIQIPQRVKDLECDVCKDVISSFRKNLEDPGSKKIVVAFLEEGCARLPGSLAQKCKQFVDENIDTVMSIIIQELDPDNVCSILKICPGSIKQEKPKKKNDIECDLCKEVVEKVEDLIKDKKTEDEIKSALDKVCSFFPSSVAKKCENFVNNYTDLLIELLEQELDPSMICAYLNICPEEVGYAQWKLKAENLECQSCQYALHFLQEQLMNPDTQEEVKNVFKKMCDVLPEAYSKNCKAFVDEYGSSLLALVSQEIDPTTMCYDLKLCSNKTSILKNHLHAHLMHSFKTDECSICTTVVDYLDKLLEEDEVDKEITTLVEKVCNVLPSSFKDKCSSLLEAYGPYILQMIGQMADSRQVCQDIDLCPVPPGHVHLVGGNKCTFGPSYWCKSSTHASACKAEMYCKEKVWKN